MNEYNKTPFRFYLGNNNELHNVVARRYQARYKLPNPAEYDFKLYTARDGFLPFQAYIPRRLATQTDATITSIFIARSASHTTTIDITADILPHMQLYQNADRGIWHVYKGQALLNNRTLDSGYWYMVINMASGRKMVSEDFYVMCNNDDQKKMSHITWGSATDEHNIIYKGGYVNWMFVEGEPMQVAPEIIQEGDENELNVFVPDKTIYIDKYELTEVMPDYLVEAITAARMAGYMNIRLPNDYNNRGYDLKITEVKPNWGDSDVLASVSISVEAVYRTVHTINENFYQSALVKPYALNKNIKMPIADPSAFAPGNWYLISHNLTAGDQGFNFFIAGGTQITTNSGNKVDIDIPNKSFWFQLNNNSDTYDAFDYTIQDPYGATASATVQLFFQPLEAVDDVWSVFFYAGATLPLPGKLTDNDWIPVGTIGSVTTGVFDCYKTQLLLPGNRTGNKVTIGSDGGVVFQKNVSTEANNWFVYTIIYSHPQLGTQTDVGWGRVKIL